MEIKKAGYGLLKWRRGYEIVSDTCGERAGRLSMRIRIKKGKCEVSVSRRGKRRVWIGKAPVAAVTKNCKVKIKVVVGQL